MAYVKTSHFPKKKIRMFYVKQQQTSCKTINSLALLDIKLKSQVSGIFPERYLVVQPELKVTAYTLHIRCSLLTCTAVIFSSCIIGFQFSSTTDIIQEQEHECQFTKIYFL